MSDTDRLKEQLATMREQLAEMAEIVEVYQDNHHRAEYVRKVCRLCRRAEQALSAAPKRGRVIAQQKIKGHYRHWPLCDHSDLILYARSFVPHMYISVPHSEAEAEQEGEFIVTVRKTR